MLLTQLATMPELCMSELPGATCGALIHSLLGDQQSERQGHVPWVWWWHNQARRHPSKTPLRGHWHLMQEPQGQLGWYFLPLFDSLSQKASVNLATGPDIKETWQKESLVSFFFLQGLGNGSWHFAGHNRSKAQGPRTGKGEPWEEKTVMWSWEKELASVSGSETRGTTREEAWFDFGVEDLGV